jgi:ABC-2 type transport system ATP-binding protein
VGGSAALRSPDLLARYGASELHGPAAWSIETHLPTCAECRAEIGSHLDAERLSRNRRAVLTALAMPPTGIVERVLGRVGVPAHLAPLSGVQVFFARSVAVLVASLAPALVLAVGLPGPGWLPVALLLPALAVSALCLAASTAVDPAAAAIGVGVGWVVLSAALGVALGSPAVGDGQAGVVMEGLCRRFGSKVALGGVDLSLGRGVTGLLGPNGAGKTTLLSILATVTSPDAGRLSVLGFDPSDGAERVEIRRRLGYLPQDLGYHRQFKVAEFLDYVAILKEIVDRGRRRAEVARVLAATDLESVAGRRMRALSGGMRRRVGIAQALLGSPELLVLDEPTAGLDPEQRLRFRELLSELPGRPVVVLSTHQADDVAAICSKVVVLLDGQVRFTGTPEKLAALAEGRVWVAADRSAGAELSWRAGDGRWRHIEERPDSGAELVASTVEDGYLCLAGEAAAGTEQERTARGVTGRSRVRRKDR